MNKKQNEIKTNNVVFHSIKADYSIPNISEIFGNTDYIKFGDDNLFPQELVKLYHNASPLHSRLIKKKADMIAGLGFNPIASLQPFLDNSYSKEDLNQIIYKCAFDLVIFGGFYLNIIWSKGGKQIAQVEHISYEKVRAQKPQDDNDDVTGYYISKDWSKIRRSENTPKLIQAFDPSLSVEAPSQLLFIKNYTVGMDYYSIPEYIPILNCLRTNFEINIYRLKIVQNGFHPSMVVILKNGIPPEDKREAEVAKYTQAYGNAINAGKPVFIFTEGDSTAPSFDPIQLNDSDEKYKSMLEDIKQEILVGHGATSMVAGIETAGKLGSRDDINNEYKLYQTTTIAQYQEIIEREVNKLARINGYTEPLKLKEYMVFQDEPTEDKVASTTLNNIKKIIK